MLFVLKNGLSIGLIIGGALQYLFPEFNGTFGQPIKTSIEHRELIGTIAFIGGLILFYMLTYDIKE
jgi:hypothetical protein